MYGKGLLKGLQITLGHFFGKAITEQYPERRPTLAARFHGLLTLDVDKCTACATCASWCPNKALTVSSARDENKKRYLAGAQVNLMYCLFCGLCVEACPDEALHFTQEFELACYSRQGMVYDLLAAGQARRAAQATADAGQEVS